MQRILYYDCFAGISGDMNLGALIHLGLDPEYLKNIPVKTGLVQYEATTPTGAAILAATVHEFSPVVNFDFQKVGYGLGTEDTEVSNVLRVFLAEVEESEKDLIQSEATLLECNIDDLSPDNYEFAMNLLFDEGASDVWIEPIIMKKSRPANKLCVLCNPGDAVKMKTILFTHTSTIGLRETMLSKNALLRKERKVQTQYGEVRLKQSFYRGNLVNSKPELEDCKKLAKKHNVSVRKIQESVIKNLEDGSY